jgi:capsular polysaccharide biosynthesis protein/Mrp family chromosome partitioning ATPase
MELQDLLSVITRRFWVVIIGTVLAVAGSYLAIRFFAPPPLYEATAAVLIGGNEDLDLTSLEMGRELAPTYVEWARRRPVLQAAIDKLEMPLSFEELHERVRVRAVGDTQFLEITATFTDPEEAATIANEVAWQLTQQPIPLNRSADTTESSLQNSVGSLRRRIDAAETELADLGNRLAIAESNEEIDALTARITALQRNLDVWNRSYSELNTVYGDNLGNFISVAEEAIASSRISRTRTLIVVAGFTGFLLAVGLAFLLEYMDKTVKTADDVTEYLSVPVLGTVRPLNGPDPGLLQRLVPRSFTRNGRVAKLRIMDLGRITVTYRRLGASIARAQKGPLEGTILVTSPTSEQDQAMTALGLAMAWAETGRKTVLIDASLRRPVIHKWLDLPNVSGLVNLLDGSSNDKNPVLLHPIGRGAVRVVTTGPVDEVSSELLLSPELETNLEELATHADLILLNAPSVLSGPEAAILASRANYILLVLDARNTRVEDAQEALDVLTAEEDSNVGVVLNRPE